jgi:hypothetical protein
MSDRVEADAGFPLRAAGRAAAMVGATASVGLTLWVGHSGLVLMTLFVGWVLLPFVGLLVADRVSVRWSSLTRATLYVVMLVIAVASVALYADVAVRPRAQPAFMFLVVPLCSWVLMVVAIGIAAFVSRDRPLR